MLALNTLLAAVVSLQTSVPAADQAAIKAAYVPFIKGYETQNWKEVAKLLSDDFRHTSPTMVRLDKAGTLKEWAASPLSQVKLTAKYERFFRNPGTTSVLLRYKIVAKLKDNSGLHDFLVEGTDDHAWRKVKDKWILASMRELSSTVSIDGKVVDVQPPKKK